MSPRESYAAYAMGVLMTAHPDACRGWIAQRAFEMADVMLEASVGRCQGAQPSPFADRPRVYAEDEAEHEVAERMRLRALPDSCRVMGRFIVGFTG